jgi:hypothetical protein
VGDTLIIFLASRLAGSIDDLNCKNFGLIQPVATIADGSRAATQATLNAGHRPADRRVLSGSAARRDGQR